jgi:hypothetical protein
VATYASDTVHKSFHAKLTPRTAADHEAAIEP